jgi:hypothetical protein
MARASVRYYVIDGELRALMTAEQLGISRQARH